MASPNKTPSSQKVVPLRAAHIAITADATMSIFKARKRTRIEKIEYLNDTGLATHASNYVAISAKNGSTVVATGANTNSSGGAAITAAAVTAMTLSATRANRILAAGDTLSLFVDATGTPTLPAGAAIIWFTELN